MVGFPQDITARETAGLYGLVIIVGQGDIDKLGLELGAYGGQQNLGHVFEVADEFVHAGEI